MKHSKGKILSAGAKLVWQKGFNDTGLQEILREAGVPKINGVLAKFDDSGECVGKCALGVISCAYFKQLTKDNTSDMSYELILDSLYIPDSWQNSFPYSRFYNNDMDESLKYSYDMSGFIYALNDNQDLDLTFNEMADFYETTFIPESKS